MQVIILAAGLGKRLRPITLECPKALVKVYNKPLLEHVLTRLEGLIERAIIVGGYKFEYIKRFLENKEYKISEVKLLFNPNYEKGNILSLLTACDYLNEEFILLNVDHIFPRDVFEIALTKASYVSVCCDFGRTLTKDDMKVQVENNMLKKIGKNIKEFNGGYIGITIVKKDGLRDYLKTLEKIIYTIDNFSILSVEDVLQYMLLSEKCPIVLDFSDFKWYEVDTYEELLKVQNIVKDLNF